jgi:predicted nucleic acid-binding protein
MTGKVVDLNAPGVSLPARMVVDANLVAEYLVAPVVPLDATAPRSINARRADWFFTNLSAANGLGIVTPTVFAEVVHVAIKTRYKQQRRRLGSTASTVYGRSVSNWLDLYKLDPTILQAFLPELRHVQRLLTASGLLFIAPEDLGPIGSGRTHDDELVHLVGAYGLDSGDASILLEAQRLGVRDIITLDADLRRAQADFTIHTWL